MFVNVVMSLPALLFLVRFMHIFNLLILIVRFLISWWEGNRPYDELPIIPSYDYLFTYCGKINLSLFKFLIPLLINLRNYIT